MFFNLTEEDEKSIAINSLVFTVEKDGSQRLTYLGDGGLFPNHIEFSKDTFNIDNLSRLIVRLKELEE